MNHTIARWAPFDVAEFVEKHESRALPMTRGVGALAEHLVMMDVAAAWGRARGAGVKVGLLDSGVVDRAGIFPLAKYLDHNGNDIGQDDNSGHGTPCASLIASTSPKAMGVAPGVELVSIRVSGADGIPTSDRIAAGLKTATAEKCDVISCSFVVADAPQDMLAAVRRVLDQGIVVVAASGNDDGKRGNFPEDIDGVIVVGAVGKQKRPLATQRLGEFTDVFAPGFPLHHIDAQGKLSSIFGKTSGATALVSGTIALALSLCPPSARRNIGRRMGELVADSSIRLPDPAPAAPHAGFIAPSALLDKVAANL